MKDRIGEIAGKTWTILGEKRNVDILKLPKILKEKGEIVYQALDWLARQDKINYHTKERLRIPDSRGARDIQQHSGGVSSERG